MGSVEPGDLIEIQTRLPGHRRHFRREPAGRDAFLREVLDVDPYENVSNAFLAGFRDDWTAAGEAMAGFLLPGREIDGLRAGPSVGHADLRLEIDHPHLAPLPWEFMAVRPAKPGARGPRNCWRSTPRSGSSIGRSPTWPRPPPSRTRTPRPS